jgi:outer membrane protein insertion porin family
MELKYKTILCVIILISGLQSVNAQIIKNVEISGNDQISSDVLFPLLLSRWQTTLDTIQVNKDIKTIENYYFEEGFLEARCRIDYDSNQDSRLTTIKFIIDEGSFYLFGNIKILGSNLLQDAFIYSLLNIKSGERFSLEKIVKSQLRAISTGLFNDVEIKKDQIDTENKIISIIINVKEKKRHSTYIGTGIDTEDGLKLFFEWKNRNINGKGVGINLTALSSIDYISSLYYKRGNFGVGFSDPFLFYFPVDWRLQLTYNSDKPKYVNFGVENYTAETSFGYSLSLMDELTLRFRIQRDRIFNATFQSEHKEFTNVFRVDDNRFVGLSYERDQRDDLIDPSTGLYLNIYLEKAGGFLGGKNTFTKIMLNFNEYFNVFRQIVIANKINLGSIESRNPESVPSYLRLFLGGSGSLRGFPERSIGPKNTDGSAQGGNFLFFNNFEIRYYLSYAFNLVTFLDAGNIWLKRDTAEINSLKYSSGIGARWRTKFGFFRLDFGLQLNEFPEKYIGRVHFGFGQSF